MKRFRNEKNRRKLTILLVIFLFVIMWIYGGWNDYNTDIDNYEMRFNNPEMFKSSILDIGFLSLLDLFHSYGVTFANAHICIYGMALLLVCFLTLKWSKSPILVLLIYFAYHFVRDVVEMRNFMAFVALIWSMQYVGRKGKINKIKLTAGLLLTILFHIAYVPFLLLLILNTQKKYNPFVWFPIFLGLSFFVNVFIANWASLLEMERLDDKVDDYLSKTHIANIASFLVISFSMFLITYFKKKSDTYIADICTSALGGWTNYNDYSRLMYNLNVFGGIFIMFSALNFSFTGRLFGGIVFLNIIYISNYFALSRKKVLDDYVFAIIYVAFILYVFPMASTHYVDVFTNNSLLRN